MLTEIICDELLDQGSPRSPIQFKTGLNVVLGSRSASNSIGKSTFLLLVDFAFGGSTYINKNPEIHSALGPHDVKFAFRFADKEHRFMRSTESPKKVYKCDTDYASVGEMTLEHFKQWLLEKYGMENLGSSFRNLTSCFFRVYGKGNCNEKEPLASAPQEARYKGLNRLIDLFGYNNELKFLKEEADERKAKKQALKDAINYNIIRPAKDKKVYEDNFQKLEELNQDLALIRRQNDAAIEELDVVTAKKVSDIKRDLSNLYRERANLQTELDTLEDEDYFGSIGRKKAFDDLLEFFPNANIKRLDEIESFHKSLKRVLISERRNATDSIYERVSQIDTKARELEEELNAVKLLPNVPEAVLQQTADLVLQIDTIKRANDLYEEKVAIADASKESKERYEERKLEILDDIAEAVNSELDNLSEAVCGPRISAPQLQINSASSYNFQIPNDSGTGSLTRSTFLFDYALLVMTPLPVIAHDTVMTKQVEDAVIVKLLKLYEESDKQIFVAIDKAETFEDGDVPKVVEENVILRLSEGHELFGRAFNRDNA